MAREKHLKRQVVILRVLKTREHAMRRKHVSIRFVVYAKVHRVNNLHYFAIGCSAENRIFCVNYDCLRGNQYIAFSQRLNGSLAAIENQEGFAFGVVVELSVLHCSTVSPTAHVNCC